MPPWLTHIHTHTQADSFWLVILLAQLASWAKNNNIPFLYCHKFVTLTLATQAGSYRYCLLCSTIHFCERRETGEVTFMRRLKDWIETWRCVCFSTEPVEQSITSAGWFILLLCIIAFLLLLLLLICLIRRNRGGKYAGKFFGQTVILYVDSAFTDGTWWFRL